MIFKLCLITKPDCCSIPHYLNFIEKAIKGGVTSVQFREKHASSSEKYHFANLLQSLLSRHQIPLLINDDIDLVVKLNAAGMHLGQSDISPLDARKILGPSKCIGLSIETFEQLEIANKLHCINYIAASAVFLSTTKTNCKTIWGLEALKKITKHSKHPVVGIGGITLENVQSVLIQGVSGIAAVNAFHHGDNPTEVSMQFVQKINQGVHHV